MFPFQDVNWGLLRNIILCSKHKKFNEAAKEAGLLPAAFSKQLKRLEKQLGVQIFERVNDNACNVLTPEGLAILRKAFKIEKILMGRTANNDAEIDDPKELKIYTTQGIASIILPGIVDCYLKKHPEYTVSIITNIRPQLIESDSIFIRTDFRLQKDLEKVKLMDMHMGFYASTDYVKKFGNPKSFHDTHGHHFLFSFGNRFTENIARDSIYIAPLVTSTDIVFSYQMCLMGHCILELPTCYKDCKNLVKVLEDEPAYTESLFIASCARKLRAASVSSFLKVAENFIHHASFSDKKVLEL
jgi:DNA-binding transcriptional LysR family regulator